MSGRTAGHLVDLLLLGVLVGVTLAFVIVVLAYVLQGLSVAATGLLKAVTAIRELNAAAAHRRRIRRLHGGPR